MDREYIAFISYRHLPWDMQVADKVHEMIERFRIPKELRKEGNAHLGIAFRDQEELPLTSDLTGDIYKALDHSGFLVVICTPDTPKSLWVTREIEYFIARHGRERVLTVLAAGTMEESVPAAITHVYDSDGTLLDIREPLAAMIAAPTREQSLKLLKKEFLRLAAAMLGCPYDSLVQRNKRYRQQLLSAALGVVAVVSLAFAGMLMNRNAEIEALLVEAQSNESVALAQTSAYTLEFGSRREAIQQAMEALPPPERPYVAAAERALAGALQVYQLKNLRVEHIKFLDPVDMQASSDGKQLLLLTTKNYSDYMLHCLDTQSGETRWTKQLTDCSHLTEIRLVHDETVVLIVHGENGAQALSLETGEELCRGAWTDLAIEGNLLLSERLMICGGYYNPADGGLVVHKDEDTVPEGSVYVPATGLQAISGERYLSMGYLSDGSTRLAVLDCSTGTVETAVNLDREIEKLYSGQYTDLFCTPYGSDHVLAIGLRGEDRYLELTELCYDGTVVRSQERRIGVRFYNADVCEMAGNRAVVAAEDFLLIIRGDTLDVDYVRIDDEYRVTLSPEGNIFVVSPERAWYFDENWNGENYGTRVEMNTAFDYDYSFVMGGTGLYYCRADALEELHMASIVGGTGTRYEGEIPGNAGAGLASQAEGQTVTVGGETVTVQVSGPYTVSVTNEKGGLLGEYRLDDCMHAATFQVDEVHGNLYVMDTMGYGTGLKVDMNTWEVTADITYLRCYLPETNEVLCSESIGSSMVTYPVYTLDELIAIGNEILGQ